MKISHLTICLFLISTFVKAQLTIDKVGYNWSRIENGTPVITVKNDTDNGDGLNDGAILIKGTANTPELQGIQYSLSGSPHNRERISLEAKYYQNAASYVKFKMQVYDLTKNLVLAETDVITTSTGAVGTTTLDYKFTDSSLGDKIVVRFVRADDLNSVRVLALDYLKINEHFIELIKKHK
ncbi:hypothetical protein ACYE2N_00945 [Flavobacterium sp. MAHUQ-51]|uniref:hypothetical protein n=1 Tax=Flavobacterium sp. GCM10022190 TaxID=3252639 RepID=UPI00360D8704